MTYKQILLISSVYKKRYFMKYNELTEDLTNFIKDIVL